MKTLYSFLIRSEIHSKTSTEHFVIHIQTLTSLVPETGSAFCVIAN